MQKNICFAIDNNILYFEKSLVDLDISIFYTCIDEEKNRYSVLCVDSENLRYLVAKSKVNDLLDMLEKKITMKRIFEETDSLWEVCTGEDYYSDQIKRVSISGVSQEDLPVDDSYYEIASEDIKEYFEMLKQENLKANFLINNYEHVYLQNTNERSFVLEYNFDPKDYSCRPNCERSKSIRWDNIFYGSSYEIKLNWELNVDFWDTNKFERIVDCREVVCCE